MAPAAIEQPVSAKDETGNFKPTRFGKDKPPIKLDKPIARPSSRGEAIRQIEEAFKYCTWDESDIVRNAALVGLEAKPLAEYTNEELKFFLDDFERRGTIIYEK